MAAMPFAVTGERENQCPAAVTCPFARSTLQDTRWLVTYSERLAAALQYHGVVQPKTVVKKNGETWIDGLRITGNFAPDEPE